MTGQRLDSPLVYVCAHNVYYVKSCLSDAKCFSGSRYSFRMHQMQTTRTPYSISFMATVAGNSNLPNTMVPPKGEVSVDIPHAATGDISFQTINDYGALTPRIKATMQ